jgi:hypothetical protein
MHLVRKKQLGSESKTGGDSHLYKANSSETRADLTATHSEDSNYFELGDLVQGGLNPEEVPSGIRTVTLFKN